MKMEVYPTTATMRISLNQAGFKRSTVQYKYDANKSAYSIYAAIKSVWLNISIKFKRDPVCLILPKIPVVFP